MISKEILKITVKNLYWDLIEKRFFKMDTASPDADMTKVIKVNRDELAGLFSYVETVMRKTALALSDGYLPYVDMRNCINPYLDKEETQIINWWEIFFEQPICKISNMPNDCVALTDNDTKKEIPHSRAGVLYKKSRYYWGKFYEQYFRLNEKSMDYFLKEYNELFDQGQSKVLGVLIRGTDYYGAKGHPIQPSVDLVIKEVRKREGRYDKIYVASDELKNIKRLEKEFPGKVIVNRRKYYDDVDMMGRSINEVSFERENDKYLRNMEYLSSIMLLSKCKGLIGGICGGTVAAVYINNNRYDDLKLFYFGIQ